MAEGKVSLVFHDEMRKYSLNSVFDAVVDKYKEIYEIYDVVYCIDIMRELYQLYMMTINQLIEYKDKNRLTEEFFDRF